MSNLNLANALEEMTRDEFDKICKLINEMRDDYFKMSSDLTKLGYQVKPFKEILREELGDMVK